MSGGCSCNLQPQSTRHMGRAHLAAETNGARKAVVEPGFIGCPNVLIERISALYPGEGLDGQSHDKHTSKALGSTFNPAESSYRRK